MTDFSADGPITADVTLGFGQVTLTASAAGSATAIVEALDPQDARAVALAAKAEVRLDGGTLTVDVRERGWRQPGAAVHVQLGLPAGSDVKVAAGELTLTAEGDLGDVRVRTGSGTLTIPVARGGIDVQSGDCALVVGTAASVSVKSGKARLSAGTIGDLSLRAGQASVDVQTTTGTVRIKGAAITLDVREVSTGDVVLDTAAGRADVGVRPGTTVLLDLRSSTGEVRCDLPMDDSPGDLGAGLRLRLKSATGSIRVSQATSAGTAA